jgi:hypothetical protein
MGNVALRFIKQEAISFLGLSVVGIVFVLPIVWFVTVVVLDVNFSDRVTAVVISASILLLPLLSLCLGFWQLLRGDHEAQWLHTLSKAKAESGDGPVTSSDSVLEIPVRSDADWSSNLGFIKTVAVRGSHVVWPRGCTCCGRDATTSNDVTRTYKDSDSHAPIERVVEVTTTEPIPVCDSCLAHIQASSAFTSGAMLVWPGAVVAMIVLGIFLTRFRSDLASMFGLPANQAAIPSILVFLIFLIAGIVVVRRILNRLDNARELSSDCTHPDGGVRFTGFVSPTEIRPTVVETRRFTFRNKELREKFLVANAENALQAEDPDDWEGP